MKRSIILLSIALCLFSCQEHDQEFHKIDASLSNLSLNLKGDFLTSFSEVFPSSGRILNTEETFIAIRINRISEGNELFYSNGLFSEIDSLTVQLNSSENYVFEIGAIRAGSSNGLCIRNNTIEAFRGGSHEITNSFSFDEIEYFQPAETSNVSLISSDNTSCEREYTPEVDFYYTKTDPFEIESDSSISIDLKRVSYGLGFEVTNLDSGQVVLNITNDLATNYEIILNSVDSSQSIIRVFDGNYEADQITDEFEENLLVEAQWILLDDNGNIQENQLIGTNTITVKRNVMRIFSFVLDFENSTSTGNGIALDFEGEMIPEEYDITFD